MSRMKPLPTDYNEKELKTTFDHFNKTLGFVPNSFLTMQRRPKIVTAFTQLNGAIFSKDGIVDLGFKRLIGHMSSFASGCQYCKAHTAVSASRHGISTEKLEAIYEYNTSPLYSDRERIALDFALAAASVPNGVTDEMYEELNSFWNEEEIVEILAVVAMFGFLNRWNDSMGTPLESEPKDLALKHLDGFTVGKHQ
ncbi:MAG: carboxymuconolactone decarboxylase family protein [Arcobacteraceae bacterium]